MRLAPWTQEGGGACLLHIGHLEGAWTSQTPPNDRACQGVWLVHAPSVGQAWTKPLWNIR
jgi:hypothetical protein